MLVREPNLVELFEASCERFRDRPLFGTKTDGGWNWIRYADVAAEVDRCRAGLASRGVGRGDKVAIISDNRVEWAVVALATYGLEASLVPMYQAQLPSEWMFILNDCGARIVFAATPAIYDTLTNARASLPGVEHVVGLDLAESDPHSFATLLHAREPVASRHPPADAVAALIYTSGTTGKPKGVILTHGNIATNVAATSEVIPLEPDDRTLSFLPWTHAYGHTAELLYGMSQGVSIAINDSIPNLVANLAEVKPTILVAVPRIFNRIYSTVNAMMAEKPALVRKLFYDGIRAAMREEHGERATAFERIERAIDERLIFHKIRERFGGRLRMVISASAALSRDVAEFIDALGIMVYEGYGLTETGPVVSANDPGHRKIGSVGRVIPGVRVVIDRTASVVPGEGEIVVYGPNVMRGYHNRPDENAKVFTSDGGFRTGDLGYMDADGYLFITGRIKEQFKLTNGKYVMPGVLEERLKLSPFIANVFVHGANRPFNVALVVPDLEAIRRWADAQGFTLGDVGKDARVRALIEREVVENGRDFPSYQVPRRVLITTEDFTTDNAMLTPTLKLKRRNVEARYAAHFDAVYAAASEDAAAHAGV